MASNSLLALLNLSSPGASPSRKIASSSSSSPPPSVVSPPPAPSNANATANTLLQSILSPNTKKQSKPALPEQQAPSPSISSPAPASNQNTNHSRGPSQSSIPSTKRSPSTPSQAAPNSANDLLALLSGTGNIRASTEEDEGDTSFHEQTPRSRLQPIGTPPNQSTRKDQSKSPVPSMFDTASLFDMLRQQPLDNGNEPTPPSTASKSNTFAAEETKSLIIPPTQRIAQPLKPAYTIKRSLHASHHLSGLHASAGFEDAISDGLDVLEVDGVEHFALDLASPQPAGLSSLYPAKLEITPISLLTTTFAPSCFINSVDEQSSLARWPSQRVAGMGGNVVMYVMSKGRVRVIDQLSGDRILARADSTIRSVFTPGIQRKGPLADNRRIFAAITEMGGLCVWLLKKDFGQSQEDAPISLQLFAESGKTFVFAQWLPRREDARMIVVQSDGLVAMLSFGAAQKEFKKNGGSLSWIQCPKHVLAEVNNTGRRPVGLSLSSDGSLVGIVEAGSSPIHDKLQLRLFSLYHKDPSKVQHTVSLPSLAQLGCSNVSFTSFVDNGTDHLPIGLLVGFDDNQVFALLDLTTGALKQLYRFKAPGSSFSLAAWHMATSSLVLCCSIRSSIFSLRLRFASPPSINSTAVVREVGLQDGQALDQADEVIHRIKSRLLPCAVLPSQPALRECALPEPYTSFALDDTTVDQSSIRILASHLGGIHALLVPEEALSQSAKKVEEQSVEHDKKASMDNLKKESDIEGVKQLIDEERKFASHGNADLTGNSNDMTSSLQSEEVPAKTEVEQRAVTPPASVAPLAPMSEKKRNGPASKQSEAKKVATSKGGKIDKSIARDLGSSDGTLKVADAAKVSSEDIKSLFSTLESNLIAYLQSQLPAESQSGGDTARLLADQLSPTMSTMIHDVLGAQLKSAVDSAVSRCLPNELHNVLLLPDLTSHLTRSITSSLLPPIQKTAMDVVSRVLAPHFETVMSEMASGIEAKISMGVTGIRKDIVTEQSKALLETEAGLKRVTMQMDTLTRSMEVMMQQNKKLEEALEKMQKDLSVKVKAQAETNGATNYHAEAASTPMSTSIHLSYPATPPPLSSLPSARNVSMPFSPHYPPIQVTHQSRQPSHHSAQLQSGPTSSIASAGAQHQPAQHQHQSQISQTGMTSQEVEDVLLSALSSPNIDWDASPLQSSLSRIASQCGSPVSAIWDKTAEANTLGKPRISQAVILTLLHRLIKSLKNTAEQGVGLSAEFAVPWIEACAAALDKTDEMISRYYNHIRGEMIESLIQSHRFFKNRAHWWTEERLAFGILRFIQ